MSPKGTGPETRGGCPLCGGRSRLFLQTQHIRVQRCRVCGHQTSHFPGERPGGDYHAQYDSSGFLEALAVTRRRQARRIVDEVRSALGDADNLVDFGCGRGWLLEAARAAGMRHVAGLDTSAMAVDAAIQGGFEAHLLPEDEKRASRFPAALSFAPRILVLLDVLEHFPSDHVVSALADLVRASGPSLELVVVKVPVSDGILFRTAKTIARLGVCGPLEQLYQYGTWPPHFSYFSRRSLHLLLRRAGLRPAREFGDPDFEPESLSRRVQGLGRIPTVAARPVSWLGRLLGGPPRFNDSLVALARPAPNARE